VLSSAYRSDAEAKCPRHRSTYAPNVASVPSQGTRRIVLRRYERRGVPEAVRVAAQLIREASGNFSFNSGEPRGRSWQPPDLPWSARRVDGDVPRTADRNPWAHGPGYSGRDRLAADAQPLGEFLQRHACSTTPPSRRERCTTNAVHTDHRQRDGVASHRTI